MTYARSDGEIQKEGVIVENIPLIMLKLTSSFHLKVASPMVSDIDYMY